MISADVLQQEIKRSGSCIQIFIKEGSILLQNLKYNVKRACIFHLILVDFLFILIFSVKKKGVGGVLLNRLKSV